MSCVLLLASFRKMLSTMINIYRNKVVKYTLLLSCKTHFKQSIMIMCFLKQKALKSASKSNYSNFFTVANLQFNYEMDELVISHTFHHIVGVQILLMNTVHTSVHIIWHSMPQLLYQLLSQ